MAPPSTRQLDSPTWSHPSRLLPSNRVTQPASWLTAFGAREPAEKPRAVMARAKRTVRLDAIPMVFPHFLNFEFVDGAAARMNEIAPSLSTWGSCPLFPRLSAKPECKILASGFVIALRAMGDAIKGGNIDGQGTVRPRDDDAPPGARGRICRSRGREYR